MWDRLMYPCYVVADAVLTPLFLLLRGNPYLDRELSGPVTLTPQWLELSPEGALRSERDAQEVTLVFDEELNMRSEHFDLLPPGGGGDAVSVRAEVVDSAGRTYVDGSPSVWMTGELVVTVRAFKFRHLPQDVTYTTVRVRSSRPLPVSKILWRCYNWADVLK